MTLIPAVSSPFSSTLSPHSRAAGATLSTAEIHPFLRLLEGAERDLWQVRAKGEVGDYDVQYRGGLCADMPWVPHELPSVCCWIVRFRQRIAFPG